MHGYSKLFEHMFKLCFLKLPFQENVSLFKTRLSAKHKIS